MLPKIYGLVWLAVIALAGLAHLTGYLNVSTLTIFGFVFSTLIFAGLVAVLPAWVNRHYSWNY